MQKIKKGHRVIILAGKDKNKVGKVLAVYPKLGKVLVENIRKVKKTEKKNPQLGKTGGIIEKEAKIHISNVAVFNPMTKKADRVKICLKENGERLREFKSNHELIDIEIK